jgi:hypothetical protein
MAAVMMKLKEPYSIPVQLGEKPFWASNTRVLSCFSVKKIG